LSAARQDETLVTVSLLDDVMTISNKQLLMV